MKAERVTPPPTPVAANIVITMTEHEAGVLYFLLMRRLHWSILRDEYGKEYGDVCNRLTTELSEVDIHEAYPLREGY